MNQIELIDEFYREASTISAQVEEMERMLARESDMLIDSSARQLELESE